MLNEVIRVDFSYEWWQYKTRKREWSFSTHIHLGKSLWAHCKKELSASKGDSPHQNQTMLGHWKTMRKFCCVIQWYFVITAHANKTRLRKASCRKLQSRSNNILKTGSISLLVLHRRRHKWPKGALELRHHSVYAAVFARCFLGAWFLCFFIKG